MAAKRRLLLNGESYEVDLLEQSRDRVVFNLDGRSYSVEFQDEIPRESGTGSTKTGVAKPRTAGAKAARVTAAKTSDGAIAVAAPMPGVVLEIVARVGVKVVQGDVLLRVEAMKMENHIFASHSGTIRAIHVEQGQEVLDGDLLLEIVE